MNRRRFLAGSVLLGSSVVSGLRLDGAQAPARAADTPAAALALLREGNQRFAKNAGRRLDFGAARAQLAGGQAPFASILGCADSRVPPELVFDQGLGDLFVVRLAGNLAADDNHAVMGSLEFASLVLGSRLIVVLGHSSCGAVNAAIGRLAGGEAAPGSIGPLVTSIKPAVERAQRESGTGDLLDRAIRVNVRMEMERLGRHPGLAPLIGQGTLAIAGGIYQLATGEVAWLD
ncbi:MAG: carbonic anhydrase [Vicinamibacterales bacterium]|nr:carbonic anhydrase [Vicinamibacterales bacterium]